MKNQYSKPIVETTFFQLNGVVMTLSNNPVTEQEEDIVTAPARKLYV